MIVGQVANLPETQLKRQVGNLPHDVPAVERQKRSKIKIVE
jgi:hypothetical protein